MKRGPDVELALLPHADAFVAELVRFVGRWPNLRREAAYVLLGHAVAVCDMMGADAEGFIASLRKTHPKPNALVPPRSS